MALLPSMASQRSLVGTVRPVFFTMELQVCTKSNALGEGNKMGNRSAARQLQLPLPYAWKFRARAYLTNDAGVRKGFSGWEMACVAFIALV